MKRALLLTLALAACGDGPRRDLRRERAEYDDALASWAANGPAQYRFEYHYSCFCPVVDAVIEVNAGAVVAASDPSTGATLSTGGLPTIPDLFARIDSAIAERPDSFEASYELTLGYPTNASLDYDDQTDDDEWGFWISSFTAL